MNLNILYEDKHIIVCEKLAKVPSQSDKTNDLDMVNIVKNHIFENTKENDPYVGIINRLDRGVGGIVLFAKTPSAAKILSEQMQNKTIKKYYKAVLTGKLENAEDKLIDYLVKDARANLSKISIKENKQSKKAELIYNIVNQSKAKLKDLEIEVFLVEIELITGRHHQIRVQMANQGAGIWGDTKYNELFKDVKGWVEIGLFAYILEFDHPKTKKKLTFEIEPKGEIFNLFT